MGLPSRLCLVLLGSTACQPDVDFDDDGSPQDVDCDDSDPSRGSGLPEVLGDGVDQDCDGSDHPTTDIRAAAAGRYTSDLPSVLLGWVVACGPDRAGDGAGDLAAAASEFHLDHIENTFAAALPGPVRGEHVVDDVLDLRVAPSRWNKFMNLLGLVDRAEGGGLFVDAFSTQLNAPLYTSAGFVTESGTIDQDTSAFVYDLAVEETNQTGLSPYAGPADLTGDGVSDYALGSVVFDRVPEGHVPRPGRARRRPGPHGLPRRGGQLQPRSEPRHLRHGP